MKFKVLCLFNSNSKGCIYSNGYNLTIVSCPKDPNGNLWMATNIKDFNKPKTTKKNL